MSILVESLPYPDTILEQYQSLKDLPDFVLLQSADGLRSRYDILSAYPYDEVIIDHNTVNSEEKFFSFTQVLEQTNLLFKQANSHYSLPFLGGAIGFISYDFGARLQNIHSVPHRLMKDMPLMAMKFYDWAIIVDHQLHKTYLVSANLQKETARLIEEIKTLWFKAPTTPCEFTLERFEPVISKEEYKTALSTIKDYLQRGRTYQVNYTQPFIAQFKGDPWAFYKKIIHTNPVPYAAYLDFDTYQIVSFSPERFLTYDLEKLTASPIKGSAPRSNDSLEDQILAENLIHSEKNKAENIMIVDLFRNDLGKFSTPGSVKVNQLCAIQSYKAVHHLVSTIEATPRSDVKGWEMFMHCFPSGSITGAPKLEAMKIIAELERYSRGPYCGCIGYYSNHGRFDFSIAIRTIVAQQNAFYLAAGGGIVMDSQWEEELQECYTKIAAFLNTNS